MAKDEKSKLLTEHYINGVNPTADGESNANLEDGEYVKFPNGSIAQVLGERHTKGGVDLVLPMYTKVMSDTKDLYINGKDKKQINKALDIKVTTKNTYSDVIDKYAKKIGYTKILNQQEDLFKKSEKEVFGVKDETTRNLNRNYFAKQLNTLEEARQVKEEELKLLFDILFEAQEDQKGTPQEERQVPQEAMEEQPEDVELESQEVALDIQNQMQDDTGEFSSQEMFKYGGQIGKVQKLATQNNIPARQLFDRLLQDKKIKELPRFDGGGLFGITFNENKIDKRNESQSYRDGIYWKGDDIITPQESLTNLSKYYSAVFKQGKLNGVLKTDGEGNFEKDENGNFILKEKVNLEKRNDSIFALQEGINKTLNANLKFINSHPDLFSGEDRQKAIEYINNNLFNKEGANTTDGLLGQVTSSKSNLVLNTITAGEKIELDKLGVTTTQGLIEGIDGFKFMSPESVERIKTLKEKLPPDSEFALGVYTPEPDKVKPAETEEDPGLEKQDVDNKIDENLNPADRYPRRFFTPSFGGMPPKGLAAETMQTIDLSRIDPVRVGIEDHLTQSATARNSANRAVEELPQTQRAAFIANTLSSSQQAEGDAITKASQINAQNQAQANLYNAGKYDSEQEYNNQVKNQYEQRMLRGLDNTEKEVRNYQAFMHKSFLNDLNNQMKLNTLDNMFSDVRVDNFGIASKYKPDNTYQMGDIQYTAEKVLASGGTGQSDFDKQVQVEAQKMYKAKLAADKKKAK